MWEKLTPANVIVAATVVYLYCSVYFEGRENHFFVYGTQNQASVAHAIEKQSLGRLYIPGEDPSKILQNK